MIAFSCTQGIVKSMGCVLVTPLVKEVIKKEKNLDSCQAAITHLTRVSTNYLSSFNMTFPPFIQGLMSAYCLDLQPKQTPGQLA